MTQNDKIAAVSAPFLSVVAPVSPMSPGGGRKDSKARQDATLAAEYRLVIEEGATKGTFVYKTLDRVTGEVIRQFPREDVVRMGRVPDYDAGAVIDTTV